MAQRDLQLRPEPDDGLSEGWTRRRTLGGLALAGGLAASRSASAQLRVDITRGNVEPIPIAISSFAADGGARGDIGQSLSDVITADLDRSGLFKTIDRHAYIQTADELRNVPRFADWRQINAQALVTGAVGPGPQGIAIEFRLWDVFAGTPATRRAVRHFRNPMAAYRP